MFALISNSMRGFFTWWVTELASLLSVAAPKSVARSDGSLVIELEKGGLKLADPSRTPHANTAAARGELVSVTEMLTYLGDLASGKSPPAISLRLNHKICFMRRVLLPPAASRDFPKLLMLDLERATPFRQIDVYTAYAVEPSQSGAKTESVRQYVVKRTLVDGIKSDIEALGLKIASIEWQDETGSGTLPVNISNESVQSFRQRSFGRLPIALAATAAALAASAAFIAIQKHETALADLRTETARLQGQAKSVRETAAKSQAAFATIANFNSLRKETVSRVSIIEEITRLLPDSAWVTDLKISAATIDLAGLATSASALVPIIEKSSYFVDATFTAPLTFDPLQNKERYGIRMRLRSVAVETEKRDEELQ